MVTLSSPDDPDSPDNPDNPDNPDSPDHPANLDELASVEVVSGAHGLSIVRANAAELYRCTYNITMYIVYERARERDKCLTCVYVYVYMCRRERERQRGKVGPSGMESEGVYIEHRVYPYIILLRQYKHIAMQASRRFRGLPYTPHTIYT